MAPKMARPAAAKAKVRARGKAQPGPRARGVRVPRRRPAADLRGEKGSKLEGLPLEEVAKLGFIVLEGASYYHRAVELCGRVTGCRVQDGQPYMDMMVSGTKDEELLKVLSADEDRRLMVHLCPAGCGGVLAVAECWQERT